MIPTLHIVTDDEILCRRDFLSLASGVMEEGRGSVAFHLRGPRTEGRDLHFLASALQPEARKAGSTLLVNDRVDLAMALDLDGAHLGQRSLPPASARTLLGPRRLLGLSVHGAAEVGEAPPGTVDFLLVGMIYPSPSHPGGVPGGLGTIREVRAVTDLPLVGIGGVVPGRVREVRGAGAHGVAARGGIWDSRDPKAATRGYLKELMERRGE